MKKIFIVLLALNLSSCFKFEPASEAIISPGPDPLANVIFRDLLTTNGIEYRINEGGYYVADIANLAKMDKLAEEATNQLHETTEIQIKNDCVAEKLRNKLIGISFIIFPSSDGLRIKANSSTFEKNQIQIKAINAEQECKEKI